LEGKKTICEAKEPDDHSICEESESIIPIFCPCYSRNYLDLYIILDTFIVAVSNGANIIDGIDGLATE
jgi:UDP-N-acetylmuramyl pentapeptide phosphotransferase/UDP-N-acetylglucosamine-1-phosphate transferase